MSSLIPVYASEHVLGGVSEYLATAFSLANPETSNALKAFLEDTERGMFHGPYVRVRLPYARALRWDGILDWMPSWFTPYHHQAEAFRRLRSKDENGDRRPEPTLVITGTGSGKTESFLYPVLDHAARTRARGRTGVKALLLYPMNALANDQADRLAKLIANEPALAGVTAGIYTGEAKGNVKKVTEYSLINDPDEMRLNPPDILLTNYKMLDQLLLRSEDREIWKKSATSLQYLVLDEFHTYDGAQGTDVALLLRRLGLMHKAHQPDGFLGEYSSNPLGRVTPVATSATLGGEGDRQKVLDFAGTIFGEVFTSDAVVGERTLTYETWVEEIASRFGAHDVQPYPDIEQLREVVDTIAGDVSKRDHADVVLNVFRTQLWDAGESLEEMIAAYAVHPLTHALLITEDPFAPLIEREGEDAKTLSQQVLGPIVERSLGSEIAREFVTHLLTAVAHLRALAGDAYGFGGKRLPGVETHLWVREVSRIERAVTPNDNGEVFRFADDGHLEWDDAGVWLPAIYCRECGRAGWMTALEPGTDAVVLSGSEIRNASINSRERTRPLIDATNEYRRALADGAELSKFGDEDGKRALMWFHTGSRMLNTSEPSEEEMAEGTSVPVLTYTGLNSEDYALDQVCPSCGETDTIRYIGSRVATLLSVGLSNLFGMQGLAPEEKKTLVFADSVQDAAHRAGFVQSRARAFGIRTLMRAVVAEPAAEDSGEVTLAQLPYSILEHADADVDPARARFELLPPEIAETPRFTPFWSEEASDIERRHATTAVLNRLELDVALEFGQRAHLPRSLVSTGALVPSVDIDEGLLLEAAETALRSVDEGLFDVQDLSSPELRVKWMRGLLEQVRERGGIATSLLEKYLQDDGNSWRLHNRYAKAEGVPSFPKGGAPEFPRSGAALDDKDRGITPLGSPRGRYARWTSKVLGISTHDATTVLTKVFKELNNLGAITAVTTGSGGTIYALKPEQVVVRHEEGARALQCGVCHGTLGVDKQTCILLAGLPCPTPGCPGELDPTEIEENYYSRLYTATSPRAVVAREHTGLIPKEERLALERTFRGAETAPNAPNVLVATPTLEMGIDIGDLSTVMLASLPKSVANYVQRVGRAGRLTGNSLVLAFVQGRGTTLPKLNDPLSMIAGSVVPPAAFLSATEILHRQVTAYLVDTMDFGAEGLSAKDAQSVFSTRKRSVVEVLTEEISAGVSDRVEAYLSTVASAVDEATVEGVRDWATGQGPDSLMGDLQRAQELWDSEVKTFTARRDVLQDRVLELDAKADPNAGTDNADQELEREKRSTKAALKRTQRDLSTILLGEYWISSMERYGLLPNFTLLDDAVELAVVVSQLNPTTMQIDPETFELSRGVSSALMELAPGNTFYARGIAATVDAVEMGHNGADIEQWRLCPACSYGERVVAGNTPVACPICGASGFADKGQVLESVRMRRVSAEVDRARSLIDGTHEERRELRFTSTLSFAVPDGGHGWRWFTSLGFGAEYLRYVNLSWFNLGRGPSAKKIYANKETDAPLFTVCSYCGHLDSQKGSNSKWDHRPWCPKRTAREEESVTVALSRTLQTQGVLLHVPVQLTAGDNSTIPSLTAAIKLGFKEVLGGDPEHLNVVTVRVPDQKGETVEALLMHDNVPGGTGYLSQFASPEDVRRLLERAFVRVKDCSCAADERMACPDCLFPYTHWNQVEVTSRAAAERALRAILSDQDRPAPETDPLSVVWETQAEAPLLDNASNLEVKFRQVLRQALEDRHATVKDVPNAGQVEWQIAFTNGEEWKMREQVNKGYTKPDFLFTHRTNPGIRPVAVFTDGAAFHISHAHYRFPDDIAKRNRLHYEESWLPWAVTDADIEWFKDEQKQVAEPPAWTKVERPPRLDGFSADGWRFLSSSPVTQLLDYLASPQTSTYEMSAKALLTLLRGKLRPSTAPEGARLTFREEIHVIGSVTRDGFKPKRFYVDAPDADSIAEDNWRDFLRFANILWLADSPVIIATSASDEQVEPEAATVAGTDSLTSEEPAATTDREAVAGAWAEAIEEFEDETAVLAALRILARAGAESTEEIGEEIGTLPTALVWPDHKIAMLIERDESYADAESELRSEGWTLIYPDTLDEQTIPAVLLGKE
ncbi:DEAD/DEAH box helicase [Corynebacterium sp. p3-SID1194]|uniref:DEAD/DEAH box helicase n=1 Tax=Corynebacterium sp. p3-SID1194 TaxID=2916105 RepID=UPI0021A30B88|nr:DEAD/DEAH box helicase [Corynebacterium sp. p3-SID1194]MCT1449932.1 DEAD/DEAH box helicase [Corynebacterium sp. p3-SID1194]